MNRTIQRWAFALAALLLAAGPAGAQQFTMKLSSPTINDVAHEWMKAFKAGVEERSKGRVKVEIYPANQLGQIPATVEGVALGTIEMTLPASGFLIGLEPRFQVFDAAGLFDSVEHGHKVLNDPDIRKRLATFGEAKGVEPLITFVHSPLMVVSHKPIRKVADFRGQKIRVPGGAPLHIEPYKNLGALPLSMPLGEVLPAMQNRTIDGFLAGITVFTTFKYYDIAKAMTGLPNSFIIVGGLVNRKFMKSLGPDLEGIVREEAAKADAAKVAWGVENAEQARQVWQKNGGELIALSPDDTKAYLAGFTAVLPAILAKNPQMKDDYDALVAAGKKYRTP
jgi:TRAP-type C4-dicarboxylate transport system substrate-binding protein